MRYLELTLHIMDGDKEVTPSAGDCIIDGIIDIVEACDCAVFITGGFKEEDDEGSSTVSDAIH